MQFVAIMRFLTLFVFSLALLVSGRQVFAQPTVATSIKPLQLIALAITDGVSDVHAVLDGTQDPHHPSLRPSQRRVMAEADVFVWVGPTLETGMERVVASLDAEIITATALPGMQVNVVAGLADPHVWLDTRNALVMASALAQALSTRDPEHADRYAANLAGFAAAVEATDAAIDALLDPASFPPFVVYHNGYQYFENQFGLAHQVSFTSNEDLQPGIRQVMAVKAIIEENNVDCVVVGPSVNTRNLDNQLERDSLRYVVIDALANAVKPAKNAYTDWMRSVANAFAGCRG